MNISIWNLTSSVKKFVVLWLLFQLVDGLLLLVSWFFLLLKPITVITFIVFKRWTLQLPFFINSLLCSCFSKLGPLFCKLPFVWFSLFVNSVHVCICSYSLFCLVAALTSLLFEVALECLVCSASLRLPFG